MKNNKILYLLTILITLFSFNMNVNAAQELTCVYEWDSNRKERVVIVQESNGSKSKFVTYEKKYSIDSLEYGAWEKNEPITDMEEWDNCKKGYFVTKEGKISFKDSDYNVELETSYGDALSPLVGTEMYIMSDKIKILADEAGIDFYEYFGLVANYCLTQYEGKCRFLAVNDDEKYDEWEWTAKQYDLVRYEHKDTPYGDIVGLSMQADSLTQLNYKYSSTGYITWLKDDFCVSNGNDKLCKMVFEYQYISDNGQFKQNSCHIVFKPRSNNERERNLEFKFTFLDNGLFEASYVQPEWETADPNVVFTMYQPHSGEFTFLNDKIHLYPSGSNLEEFGSEYIQKYKEEKGCPNIVLCVDDASDGGDLNWYLELGNATEINATGKYDVGICYDYDEETGQIIDIYVRDELTYNLLSGIITIEGCEDLFNGDEDSEKVLKIIKSLFILSRISIPLIIIGMGSMDFVKCIFSGNEDGMKKAQNKFMMRLLLGVGIFLVPTLLEFILEIAKNIWPNISSDLCGILE